MPARKLYTAAFYENDLAAVASSASRVVPFLLQQLPPTASVIDFGCGVGTWLHEFVSQGVGKVVGVDGDHVERRLLAVDPGAFVAMDLRSPRAVGSEHFDLALCLEVAEHLPEPAGVELVAVLAASADAVLFGAAIPGQDDLHGGTGHITLRWPSFWAEKFAAHGMYPDDCVRRAFWTSHPDVTFHYPQNALLYRRVQTDRIGPLDVVHPELARRLAHISLGKLAKSAPRAARATFRSRFLGRPDTPT